MNEVFEYFVSGASAIVILGILIFVHELGHFLVAKWCGVGVLEFAIGFGKKLYTWKRRETEYSLRAIPLGGFVRMMGDDPFLVAEESASAEGKKSSENSGSSPISGIAKGESAFTTKEQLGDPSKWFLNKPLWARTAVVLAGPLFNLIFAFIVAIAAVAVFGKAVASEEAVIGIAVPDTPAAKAGLKAGDKVLSIDGVAISSWSELSKTVRESGGRELVLLVERREKGSSGVSSLEIRVSGTREHNDFDILDGSVEKDRAELPVRIGIQPEVYSEPATLAEALTLGSLEVYARSEQTIRILSYLVRGKVDPTKVLGGPVSIVEGAAKSAWAGIETTLGFMVLLSVSLAIFNLLPIPILDGGHLMFFLVEAIKGSPVHVKWQAVANQVGFALLMLLMVFAMSNDLLRVFSVR